MAGYAVKVEEPEPEQFAEHPGRREKDGIFFVEKRQMEETFRFRRLFPLIHAISGNVFDRGERRRKA